MPEIVNTDQAAAWNGAEGESWTANEDHFNAAIRRHGLRLIEAVESDDQVLDVGCGCGESTRQAAGAASSGSALGIDLSARMIARARERSRAAGLTNTRFEQADAQVHPFAEAAFDLAISRFGVMFFADPVAAFVNIGRALRPDGRLALLVWRGLAENDWLSAIRGAVAAGRTLPEPETNAPGPFGLADPAMVRQVLTGAGFEGIELVAVDEPLWLGTDTDDAFGFVTAMSVTRGLLDGLDATARADALRELRATLAAHEGRDGVQFGSAAWLITARRARP
jgi:SAM-dependent methyltransferase